MHHPELYADVSRKVFQQRLSDMTKMVDSLTWSEVSSSSTTKVLDVGCGPGDFTARDLLPRLLERRKNYQVVGVDSELSMVRYASDHYARPGVLSFHHVDISHPDIEATDLWREMAPVDKIFSYYCLQWVKDQRQAAKNLFKLLSDDHGEAVLVFVAKDGIAEAYRSMAGIPRWRDYLQDREKHVWPYQHSKDPAEDFRQLMEETGFTVDTCICETRYYGCDTEDGAKDMISSISPFVKRIPEEERSDFAQDLLTECLRSKYLLKTEEGNGGRFIGNSKALLVKAQKVNI